MAMLDTPSRIWRRIEDVEARDMPSLPSLPGFNDSADSGQPSIFDTEDDDLGDISSPIQAATTSPASPLPEAATPSQQTEAGDEEPVTPHTRRRSFLLSVINSTARPRLKFPTPYPRRSKTIESGSRSPSASGPASGEAVLQWQTPVHSPDDNLGDRASFISTASSHDLTTHHRANTSFDPAMGLGTRGHGHSRFNAGKLNAYLHGLNRRLQEENEGLVDRLKRAEVATTGSRPTGGARRISVGAALGDVEEDVRGEGWVEEKAELEELVDAFKEEVQQCISEKEELEKALDEEREARVRDRVKWKERMGEVEKGVEGIVKELEERLSDAEKRTRELEGEKREHFKDMEKRLASLEAQRDLAMERAQKAELALESGVALGGELREANERVGKIMGDLRNANTQISELEEEVMMSDRRIDQLEKALLAEKEATGDLEQELQIKLDELAAAQNKIGNLEEEAKTTEEDLRAASELASQMDVALEAAEKKVLASDQELADFKERLSSLEQERAQEGSASQSSQNHITLGPTDADLEALENELDNANREIARLSTLLSQSPLRKAMDNAKDIKIDVLEREKEDLLEKIQALRMTVTGMGTPSKIINNNSGISPIHRQALSMSMRAPKTPGGPLRDMSWLNNTSADPTVSPLIAEITRLQRDLDRANESIDDKLDRLEDAGLGVVGLTQQLEDARSRIATLEEDIAKLSRREDRRMHRLEIARCQKCHGKVDLRSLHRAAEGDESSLEISRESLSSDPPTPPTKTSEALRANLQSVHKQLDGMKQKWEEEKRLLVGEKAVLQDAAHRLNAQVLGAKEEAKRVVETEEQKRISVQEELNKVKLTIADLEADLKSERANLRALTAEQNRVQRDKEDVLLQLQRTELDMDDVKKQLYKFKQQNHELETELRANANADQKARLLEVKVAETIDVIEQLRQERSFLNSDHKELQRRFSAISEHANKLREEHAASQTSHDNRRHQLDLHRVEIDDLRRALSDQADELQRAEAEKNRIAAERSDVTRTVAALEADLKRVQRDAESFGRDLRLLRAEKDKLESKHREELLQAERTNKEDKTQMRLLDEKLHDEQRKAMQVLEELRSHVCALDQDQLSALKIQHNRECKGLIVQIRYLKAKFTREASLRCDLGYQKQYILILLSRFEKSERTVLASIARIGFPVAPPVVAKSRSLKGTVLTVIFILRARHASNVWREASASKGDIATALQEVRRRRS